MKGGSKQWSEHAIVQALKDAGGRNGRVGFETAEQAADRSAALASLGEDCRREERRRRVGRWVTAAAVLVTLFAVGRTWSRGMLPEEPEALAEEVMLPSFPRQPFALDFDVASQPRAGTDPFGPLRSTSSPGPRILAPLGAVAERRPEVRFEHGNLPEAEWSKLSVSLRNTFGNEIEADVLDCGEVCRAVPKESLSDGEWVVHVRLDDAHLDWSDHARFAVRPTSDVEALLAELEPTGSSQLDCLVSASLLIDSGFAELASVELSKLTSLVGLARARAILLEARAARILGQVERLEPLRNEWLALRSAAQDDIE